MKKDMKKNIKLFSGVLIFALSITSFTSCNKEEIKKIKPQTKEEKTEVILKDYGNNPLVINIEDYTLKNENFRTTLWTGSKLQVTLMSIPVGEEIGLEQHNGTDQFLRIEEGEGKVMMGDSEENLDFVKDFSDDFVIIFPSGKWHNIKNTGDKPLKIYSIYSPVEHPVGTVHKTKADE
jgi:mannose-6-phosphate isomerase-like protein (cupin superfamily)